ncbi:caspase family protein [Prosthecodimorpha staleyi]|uniref:Caspase family protein n=1 Tax=Prosthecodimorpha staleyi TaxID=2840188 RepID=A0A947GH17_9HYPH|nr:caspase family protein [Prosthecodimorpha staleyi]MBT9293210.1 caspase family protein [Prosthecodimorpha staleyi]
MLRRFWITVALGALTAAAPAGARDLASYAPEEISALQRRLTDAGCYTGAIDGRRNEALTRAVGSCPDQEPVLRIETGMHSGLPGPIGVDAACTVLATGAADKTVRLWSMPDGRPIETLRLPVGAGNFGKIYATALSADGRYVAAGGWDAARDKGQRYGIYLFDRVARTMRRIGDFDNVIDSLAFSRDSRRIVAGLGRDNGIRVLDVATGRELMADKDYKDDTYGVLFDAAGTLYATSSDGFIRRYDAAMKRTHKIKAPDGPQPAMLAIDPTGRRLAVGYDETVGFSMLDAATLQPLAKADIGDIKSGTLYTAAWSSDGRFVMTAGRTGNPKIFRALGPDGRKVGTDRSVQAGTILDLKTCGDKIAYMAADPTFGTIAADGKVSVLQMQRGMDARNKLRDAFTVSPDGRSVRFGLGYSDTNPVLFDLDAGGIADAPNKIPTHLTADITGLKVEKWEDEYETSIGGKKLELDSYERARSLAVRPDRSGFALGTGWALRAYDAKGTLRWRQQVPATTWGVNMAQEGRIMVAAHADGTLRWYRWSDGKELLALFIDVPTRRWVAWTPTGYYTASAGGEDLIGWHVNRGWNQLADFFPAARFRDRFNRPDVVAKVLDTLDEDQAVVAANAVAKRKPDTAVSIETQLPPVITVVPPAGGSNFTGQELTLEYELRSPSGLPVTGIDVLIDGRAGDATRGIARTDGKPIDTGKGRITVNLPQRDVEVSLIARAGDKTSEPARVKLAYAGQKQDPAALLKPKLYVLAVGVAKYQDSSVEPLGLPGKDASDFAKAMLAQKGGIYGDVVVRSLIDGDATRDGIVEGLEWLEKQVTSRDIGMIFLAGHGYLDNAGAFWFLPVDASISKLRSRGINKEDIRSTLSRLAGKAVLFLDACHAAGVSADKTRGSVDINGVVNELAASENGVVVFGSSTGKELSIENAAWGNGAFTKAVIEGIAEGKADLLKNGVITLSELDVYVAERVKVLTDGRQHPVMSKPGTIPDFSIAIQKR